MNKNIAVEVEDAEPRPAENAPNSNGQSVQDTDNSPVETQTASQETGEPTGRPSSPTPHGDEDVRPNLTMRDFLGGDILARGWIRKQMGIILLLVALTIIYITNRYSAEQEIIEIKNLKEQYQEIKYRALTRSSELTEKSRQSQLEELMRHSADSVLTAPKEPPFKLLKPAEE